MIGRVLGFVGLCGVVLLAGCDADVGEPGTLPDVTPSPSASVSSPDPSPTPDRSPTPTVEPPVEPANAHEYSAEGVEAFTLYAIDVINYAYQTNDVTYLEQIMTPDCQTCANIVESINGMVEQGERVEGGQIVPERLSVTGPAEGFEPSAGIDLVLTASRTLDSQGVESESEEDRSLQYIFDYVWEGDVWQLDGIRRGAERSE